MLEKKRAYLERRLKETGFRVLPAQGTYFLVADFRQADAVCLNSVSKVVDFFFWQLQCTSCGCHVT